ncbi:hypothetical protein KFK09_009248 [Dendrobium nobile]|uniref:Uncharacterized protein n=1 Tax=Dendrobium nobile TaxID=94219 RepID=A0A8T3BMV0_DENNO|nr:hypothetical protein KFK09_009248 [Dendrobium nobile]
MEVYLLHTKAPRRRVFPFASLLDSDVSSSSSPAPVYPSVRKKKQEQSTPLSLVLFLSSHKQEEPKPPPSPPSLCSRIPGGTKAPSSTCPSSRLPLASCFCKVVLAF